MISPLPRAIGSPSVNVRMDQFRHSRMLKDHTFISTSASSSNGNAKVDHEATMKSALTSIHFTKAQIPINEVALVIPPSLSL